MVLREKYMLLSGKKIIKNIEINNKDEMIKNLKKEKEELFKKINELMEIPKTIASLIIML